MNLFSLLHAYSDWGLIALRMGLAAIFFTHGTRKLGMWKMRPSEQMPSTMLYILRFLSIAEPLGAIAAVTGFLTQAAALGFASVMLNAINLKITKWKQPFINPDMSPGWEFDFILLCAALALATLGAGAFSLDHMILGL